jgi:hypothetical protein
MLMIVIILTIFFGIVGPKLIELLLGKGHHHHHISHENHDDENLNK